MHPHRYFVPEDIPTVRIHLAPHDFAIGSDAEASSRSAGSIVAIDHWTEGPLGRSRGHSRPASPQLLAATSATAGALGICGGRYTLTATMPAARMIGTMIGAYLMMGSYVTTLTSFKYFGKPNLRAGPNPWCIQLSIELFVAAQLQMRAANSELKGHVCEGSRPASKSNKSRSSEDQSL
jgi:hypothetical protein